jgi:predicted nuclease of predicted toxin-antitoxin system
VILKLLLDENLSPKIAPVLWDLGIDACSVRDRGWLHASDPELFKRAFEEDRIVVTLNVGDFAKLAAHCQLHAGVVLIHCIGLLREEQLAAVCLAIEAIKQRGDMVNTRAPHRSRRVDVVRERTELNVTGRAHTSCFHCA